MEKNYTLNQNRSFKTLLLSFLMLLSANLLVAAKLKISEVSQPQNFETKILQTNFTFDNEFKITHDFAITDSIIIRNRNFKAASTVPKSNVRIKSAEKSQGSSAVQSVNKAAAVCYNPATLGQGEESTLGITLLQRAGNADTDNWPMVRKSAHVVLESNLKGFVITRNANPAGTISTPQEGMMVYDTVQRCLKLYSDGIWACFSTPACP